MHVQNTCARMCNQAQLSDVLRLSFFEHLHGPAPARSQGRLAYEEEKHVMAQWQAITAHATHAPPTPKACGSVY